VYLALRGRLQNRTGNHFRVDGRGEKFRGDSGNIFRSGRILSGRVMNREDLPGV